MLAAVWGSLRLAPHMAHNTHTQLTPSAILEVWLKVDNTIVKKFEWRTSNCTHRLYRFSRDSFVCLMQVQTRSGQPVNQPAFSQPQSMYQQQQPFPTQSQFGQPMGQQVPLISQQLTMMGPQPAMMGQQPTMMGQPPPVYVQVFTLPAVILTLLVTLLILEPDNVQVEECSGNEGATMGC